MRPTKQRTQRSTNAASPRPKELEPNQGEKEEKMPLRATRALDDITQRRFVSKPGGLVALSREGAEPRKHLRSVHQLHAVGEKLPNEGIAVDAWCEIRCR